MSALIIHNIPLIFAWDDLIMVNIDRLNQFFDYKKGLYDKDYFEFKSNAGFVQEYIQTVLTQATLYSFNFKCVFEPGNV